MKPKRKKTKPFILKFKGNSMNTEHTDNGREIKTRNRSTTEDIQKYDKAFNVYQEREGEFTLKDIASKHQLNYQNFLNYLKRAGKYTGKPRKTEVTFEMRKRQEQEQIALYNHSVIAIKYGELEALLKDSLEKGISQSARKFINEKRAVVINLL